MNFGKISNFSTVNFQLPSNPERTLRVLNKALLKHGKGLNIYIGATGWSNKEWLGKWYPSKTKPGDFLDFYSKQFNTIEFNTTHYRVPNDDLIERWYLHAAADFKFCPKIPQQISHRAKLRAEEPSLRFSAAVQGLQEKLGPCFLQLPEHHGPQELQLIQEFLDFWPSETALHWEFRHKDWFWNEGGLAEKGFDMLESRGQGTVITDVAGRRDVLHMQLTNPHLMLRFVGNGLHATDYQRSDDWIQRIAEWAELGLQSAWIFIHQPEMEQVPDFTAYWVKKLNSACGTSLHVPKPISQPIQGSLF